MNVTLTSLMDSWFKERGFNLKFGKRSNESEWFYGDMWVCSATYTNPPEFWVRGWGSSMEHIAPRPLNYTDPDFFQDLEIEIGQIIDWLITSKVEGQLQMSTTPDIYTILGTWLEENFPQIYLVTPHGQPYVWGYKGVQIVMELHMQPGLFIVNKQTFNPADPDFFNNLKIAIPKAIEGIDRFINTRVDYK